MQLFERAKKAERRLKIVRFAFNKGGKPSFTDTTTDVVGDGELTYIKETDRYDIYSPQEKKWLFKTQPSYPLEEQVGICSVE